VKAIAYATLLAVFGLGFLGFTGREAVTYLSGEESVAVVEACSTERAGRRGSETTCLGSWIVDGEQVTGEIRGAPPSDAGRTVNVRVNDGVAYRWRWARVLTFGVIGLLLLGGAALWAGSTRGAASDS
jgi:hypothetical protein